MASIIDTGCFWPPLRVHTEGGTDTTSRPNPKLVCLMPGRYDVELDRARKPCLKAVLQGDASASRPMVLCVSRVYNPEDLGTRGGAAAAVVEVCVYPPTNVSVCLCFSSVRSSVPLWVLARLSLSGHLLWTVALVYVPRPFIQPSTAPPLSSGRFFVLCLRLPMDGTLSTHP